MYAIAPCQLPFANCFIGPVGNNFKAAQNTNTQLSGGQLKNLLIANSPLSDEVIIALINSNNPLSPGLFKNVMEINMPVSNAIWQRFNAYLKTLPPGIAKQLIALQFEVAVTGTTNKTLAELQLKIDAASNQKNTALSSLISYYLSNDSVPELSIPPVIALLENENTPQANRMLAGTYIQLGDTLKAQQKLEDLPYTSAAEKAYVDLYTLYFNLKRQNRNLWDIDSLELIMVHNIANMCPPNEASLNAQALLQLMFYEMPKNCPSAAKLALPQPEKNATFSNSGYYLGNNIPNPFSENTLIPYLLPDGTIKATLNIVDITGRIIKKYELQPNESFVEVNLNEYNNGIYLYELRINEKAVQTKRMILAK